MHCACAEVGQGFVTLPSRSPARSSASTTVVLPPADTAVGSAGSTSASRQTWIAAARCRWRAPAVREVVLERAALDLHLAPADMVLGDGEVTTKDGTRRVSLAEALRAGPVEAYREYHHAPTEPLDDDGQGNAHWSFAFAAHRAVVDVDAELGLVRVVQMATAQDVGRRSTRSRSPARSRAASPRASGWR